MTQGIVQFQWAPTATCHAR